HSTSTVMQIVPGSTGTAGILRDIAPSREQRDHRGDGAYQRRRQSEDQRSCRYPRRIGVDQAEGADQSPFATPHPPSDIGSAETSNAGGTRTRQSNTCRSAPIVQLIT